MRAVAALHYYAKACPTTVVADHQEHRRGVVDQIIATLDRHLLVMDMIGLHDPGEFSGRAGEPHDRRAEQGQILADVHGLIG